ncbi:hypothetical protein CRM22_003863 [Opisthorchis felineus]|uniref:UPAR/Ly6 domain-containing protein n=1 Tax=Opisthorchis felineus TaxID=147828 RepID=A0A4S2M5A7_OPIFE|nr:hypothetical protein CRM22_003863 [Opisthorchis felineus]
MTESKAVLFVLTAILLRSSSGLKCFDCDNCPENPTEGNVTVKDGCGACLITRAYASNVLSSLTIKCSPTCPPINGAEIGSVVGVKVGCCYTDLCTAVAVLRNPNLLLVLTVLLVLHTK